MQHNSVEGSWWEKNSPEFLHLATLQLEYFLSSKRPIRIRLTCSYVNKSGRVDRPLFIPIKPMLFYGKQFLTLTLCNFSSKILQFLTINRQVHKIQVDMQTGKIQILIFLPNFTESISPSQQNNATFYSIRTLSVLNRQQ